MPRKRRETPWFERWRGGTFYAFWYDPEARQRRSLSLGTQDAGEAGARFAAFLTQGAPLHAKQTGKLNVAAVLDDYLREHEAVAQFRNIDCARHISKHLGHMTIANVDIPTCRDYAAVRRSETTRHGRPPSDSTLRRELAILSAACNHAVRWRRLSRADLPSIELPPKAKPKELWLFRDELAKLLAGPAGYGRDFAMLTYYTAARRDSAGNLTVFQVALEPRWQINLSPADDVVTNKRRVPVPIDPAIRPLVKRLVAEATAAGRSELLEPGHNTNYQFSKAADVAGVLHLPARESRPAGRCTPHTLRHTRATHLLQDGVKPWAVAGLLGDTVATVLHTYGHHCPDYLAEVLGERPREIEL